MNKIGKIQPRIFDKRTTEKVRANLPDITPENRLRITMHMVEGNRIKWDWTFGDWLKAPIQNDCTSWNLLSSNRQLSWQLVQACSENTWQFSKEIEWHVCRELGLPAWMLATPGQFSPHCSICGMWTLFFSSLPYKEESKQENGPICPKAD